MKLKGKLLLSIVPVILFSQLALGWLVYRQLQEHSRADIHRQIEYVLTDTDQQVRHFLDSVSANVTLFANANLLERYFKIEEASQRFDLMQRAVLKSFANYQDTYPYYEEISLLTPDGLIDTTLAVSQKLNSSTMDKDNDWFQRLRTTRKSVYSTIRSTDNGRLTLLAGAAVQPKTTVYTPMTSRSPLKGYLVTTARLDFLEHQINSLAIGNSGYLFATDAEGRIVLHADSDRIGQSVGGQFKIVNDHADMEEVATITIDDQVSLAKAIWLHDDLLLAAVVPESEFTLVSTELAVTVALITIGAIIFTIALIYHLMNTMVLRPINLLKKQAIAIGEGDLNAAVDLKASDEVGELATAFQDMHNKLGSTMRELRESHARNEHLALHDSLTNLPNRRQFRHLLVDAIEASVEDGSAVGVLFLDLDDFKRVNDTLGHESGDELLRVVSMRLQECVRSLTDSINSNIKNDSLGTHPVSRLGGDEFIVLLRGLCDPGDLNSVAERLQMALSVPIVLGENTFSIGSSIGIACYPDDALDADSLIKCADIAMYESKRSGEHAYLRYGTFMQTRLQRRIELETDLRAALDQDQFELHYQPQFNAQSGRIIGVEALIRWDHPEKGMVSPQDFIQVAEETGLIGELGNWVLIEACRQWREWADLGIAPDRIAVNVSNRQFDLGDMVTSVQHAMNIYRLRPFTLEIELTESSMMTVTNDVLEILGKIRAMGARIAMDDFGTGYSSLSALTSLPIDAMKMDRSFVVDLGKQSVNEKVVLTILNLASSLELEVVAEGVETEVELDFLRANGCDVIQGFLLGRPLAAARMTERLYEEYPPEQLAS